MFVPIWIITSAVFYWLAHPWPPSRDYGYQSLYVIKFITWSDSRITLKKYIEIKKKMSQFNTFHTFRNLTYILMQFCRIVQVPRRKS